MKTFINLFRAGHIPRDGYYYPGGYIMINAKLSYLLTI